MNNVNDVVMLNNGMKCCKYLNGICSSTWRFVPLLLVLGGDLDLQISLSGMSLFLSHQYNSSLGTPSYAVFRPTRAQCSVQTY